jgi:hypothetical protein
VFCVTPSLFVQADVAASHVPSALQISCALHVDPLLHTHSARLAVPLLFAQSAGGVPLGAVVQVPAAPEVPSVHNSVVEHSGPLTPQMQASLFNALPSVTRHMMVAVQKLEPSLQ